MKIWAILHLLAVLGVFASAVSAMPPVALTLRDGTVKLGKLEVGDPNIAELQINMPKGMYWKIPYTEIKKINFFGGDEVEVTAWGETRKGMIWWPGGEIGKPGQMIFILHNDEGRVRYKVEALLSLESKAP